MARQYFSRGGVINETGTRQYQTRDGFVNETVASEESSVSQSQSGIARILAQNSNNQTGISRILQSVGQQQTGIARISQSTSNSQLAISRILTLNPKSQTAISAILNSVNKSQSGIATISAASEVTLLTDIISYWPCEGIDSSQFTLDIVGNNDFSVGGNTAYISSTLAGKINRAVYLNPEEEGEPPTEVALEVESEDFAFCVSGNIRRSRTLAFWVNFQNAGDRELVSYSESGSNYQWKIYRTGGVDKFVIYSTGEASNVECSLGSATAATDWHLYVISFNADTGEMLFSRDDETPITNTVVGGFNINILSGGLFRHCELLEGAGSIRDEIGFWGRAFEESDILEFWNGGDGITYPFESFVSQTISGISRIQNSGSQTQSGIARISTLTTTDQIQSGVSRIQISYSQSQSAIARILNSNDKPQSGISRIQSFVSNSISGQSRILQIVSNSLTCISRISVSNTNNLSGISRITASSDNSLTGQARIQKTSDSTQSGISRVQNSVDNQISGQSRILNSVSNGVGGIARISKNNNDYGISCISRVLTVNNTQISGISRINSTNSETISGISAIAGTSSQSISGIASISVLGSVDKTQTGISRINLSISKSISGIAAIAYYNDKVISGRANITKFTGEPIIFITKTSVKNKKSGLILGGTRVKTSITSTTTRIN